MTQKLRIELLNEYCEDRYYAEDPDTQVLSLRYRDASFAMNIKDLYFQMNIGTDIELREALIAVGVTEMSSDKADLTGISKAPPLKVSDAAHKAIIEVSQIRSSQ
ncbi:hypothetical protein ANCCAN_12318 [Ancylostoma caninum]|uniref:Serpin domain-containing protein n=1 Tax=Ancylostoma caninum TaxID=29170 RepID=A0A368GBC7_ANCCA|nr:hypothetical protein ANCCAN_12318 [Ancylostoma caninum]